MRKPNGVDIYSSIEWVIGTDAITDCLSVIEGGALYLIGLETKNLLTVKSHFEGKMKFTRIKENTLRRLLNDDLSVLSCLPPNHFKIVCE